MTESFPWTEDHVTQLLRGFLGNTSFKVNWPWAPFHSTGFQALRWAAFKNMTVPEIYKILDDLSCPSVSKKHLKKFKKIGLLDLDDRIIPLNPGLTMKRTFKLAKENITDFKKPDLVLLTIDDLLKRNPSLATLWRPVFKEDRAYIEKWLSNERSLLNSFQSAPPWDQLKVVEALVGVAKPLSPLNFERIY